MPKLVIFNTLSVLLAEETQHIPRQTAENPTWWGRMMERSLIGLLGLPHNSSAMEINPNCERMYVFIINCESGTGTHIFLPCMWWMFMCACMQLCLHTGVHSYGGRGLGQEFPPVIP